MLEIKNKDGKKQFILTDEGEIKEATEEWKKKLEDAENDG